MLFNPPNVYKQRAIAPLLRQLARTSALLIDGAIALQ
jgi:hypothetical protein